MYYHHTGYVGGLKSVKYYAPLWQPSPKWLLSLPVKGMLPKNKIGAASLGRLKVYRGAEHEQQAQKPVVLEVK